MSRRFLVDTFCTKVYHPTHLSSFFNGAKSKVDCETLSPNARKIFDKIKEHYLNPQWTEDGTVFDNGWQDLRKGEVRGRLIERCEHQIGAVIVMLAKGTKEKGEKITESVFDFRLSRRWIELAVLLYELDFQIETVDLVG